MLPKKHRFQLRQVPTFFDTAAKLHNRHFTVFYTQGGSVPEFAVIVPKKQFLRATDRNMIRRKTVAALQLLLSQVPPVQAAIVIKRAAGTLSVADLKTELERALASIQ